MRVGRRRGAAALAAVILLLLALSIAAMVYKARLAKELINTPPQGGAGQRYYYVVFNVTLIWNPDHTPSRLVHARCIAADHELPTNETPTAEGWGWYLELYKYDSNGYPRIVFNARIRPGPCCTLTHYTIIYPARPGDRFYADIRYNDCCMTRVYRLGSIACRAGG